MPRYEYSIYACQLWPQYLLPENIWNSSTLQQALNKSMQTPLKVIKQRFLLGRSPLIYLSLSTRNCSKAIVRHASLTYRYHKPGSKVRGAPPTGFQSYLVLFRANSELLETSRVLLVLGINRLPYRPRVNSACNQLGPRVNSASGQLGRVNSACFVGYTNTLSQRTYLFNYSFINIYFMLFVCLSDAIYNKIHFLLSPDCTN